MKCYLATWEIDIEADSPAEAAEKARRYAVAEDTTATVFRIAERVAESGGIDNGPVYEHRETFDVKSAPSFPHFKAVPWSEAEDAEPAIAEDDDAHCRRVAQEAIERACGLALGDLSGDCPPDLTLRFERIQKDLGEALQLLVKGNQPAKEG